MKDKVAVVTGAGTGIGQGIALALGRRGAAVVVHYNSSEAGAREVVQALQSEGGRAMAVQADLSQVSECRRLIATCIETYSRIDILVNNTGITAEIPILDITEDDWDRVLNTNLRSHFFCAQSAARQMIQQGQGGKIINLSSVHGFSSWPWFACYAASKGGVNQLTRQMAIELAQHHINVNAVAPGAIEVERYFRTNPHYTRERAARRLPMRRVGFPEDIGKAVAFLASDEADFITGQVLTVDGGQLALLPMVPDDMASAQGMATKPQW